MTRFRSNLYNMVIGEGCFLGLRDSFRPGKLTGCAGRVLPLFFA